MKKHFLLFATLVISVLLCSCGQISGSVQPPTDSSSDVTSPITSESSDSDTTIIETIDPTSSASPDVTIYPSDTPSSLPSSEKVIPSESVTEGVDEAMNIMGIISFGMTLAETRDILLANGFPPEDFSGTQFSSTLDNGVHNCLDVWSHAFTFDVADALYYFSTSQASTARGFTPGENVTRMVELYGNDYHKCNYRRDYGGYDDDRYFYEYDFGEYYLVFYSYYDTDIINTWTLSRYSFDESWDSDA